MRCNICGYASSAFARARILAKYDVQYYACENCGFVQTEAPYWLKQAYSDSIARSDIGLIGRNIKLSNVTALVVRSFFDPKRKFLDYGGGTGMFVRLMRDKGFDFHWSDKYTKNQFAIGFESQAAVVYEAVTAFEVFEHLTDPLGEVDEMLKFSRNILFSTTPVPQRRPSPYEWWYYALDTGQHVSLYSMQSLLILARKLDLNLYSNGVSVHLLTQKKLSPLVFRLITIPQISAVISPLALFRRKSLLAEDYFQITGRQLR